VNFRQWYEQEWAGAAFIGTPGLRGSGKPDIPDYGPQDKYNGHGLTYGARGTDQAEKLYGIKRRLWLKKMKKMVLMDK
jgi:hypothetical protein